MAFNSENDPDLLIGVEFLGKNFSNRRDDPSIHTGGEEIIDLPDFCNDEIFYESSEIYKHHREHPNEEDEEVDPWEMLEDLWQVRPCFKDGGGNCSGRNF